MGTTPWSGESSVQEGDNNPAVYISWNDCQDFISALNDLDTDHIYRLPSESEWEYFCRAGSYTEYCYGNDPEQLGDYAWYDDNAYFKDESYGHEVGLKLPNDWGLYDMHGNVWEWCQDWNHDSYFGAPNDGTAWEYPSGTTRIRRGGSWIDTASLCQSAFRMSNDPDVNSMFFGFRLICVEA
jgi:formylglycine-generating enzyme required for sulfatase activity